MSSFEELGLSPAIVEALATAGVEAPTELQEHAIPPLRRGTSVVLAGGPGSGLLVAYGAALLDRIEPEGEQPLALILTHTRAEADALAASTARLALATGHRVGALGAAWAFPERAHVLFASLADLDAAVRAAQLKLDSVETLVINDASVLVEDPRAETVFSLLDTEGAETAQVVIVADPVTSEVRGFVERHARRAVFVPPGAASRDRDQAPLQRGALEVRTVHDEIEGTVASVVQILLDGGAEHVVTFVRSEDAAADLGDALTLRGFLAGAPGDPDAPVWLGLDPMLVRKLQEDRDTSSVAVLSVDVPSDADGLDRRHGGWGGRNIVLARPRETAHLRRMSAEAGYALDFSEDPGPAEPADIQAFLDQIEEALEGADLGAYAVLLEPLLRRHGASLVAAALASIVRTAEPQGRETPGRATQSDGAAAIGTRPPAWVKLFMSVGRRDGVGAGDLLGAIIGETGVSSEEVGRIDLRDTFSRVDVQDAVAETVIQKLNGTSIRGRSVRVDFDRGESRGPSPSRGPKGGRDRGGARSSGKGKDGGR